MTQKKRPATLPADVVKVIRQDHGARYCHDLQIRRVPLGFADFLTCAGFRCGIIGSFNHGSMANALPQAIGVQATEPGRQVVTLSGDGGVAMLLGELITLRQQHLPVKVVVFNNGALSFVELEMKAAGIVTYGTDLDNPDFAAIAQAAGLFGAQVNKADDLEDALRAAFGHDGPALVDVHTDRYELSLPPKLTYGQIKGFTLYATRTILSGEGKELVELTKTNLRDLDVE